MDLGKTQITSSTEPVLGRWKSIANKEVWVTKFDIYMRKMGIVFYDSKRFEIAKSFDLQLSFEKLNQ